MKEDRQQTAGTAGAALHPEHHARHPIGQGLLIALAGFAILSVGDAIVKSMAGQWPGPAIAALRYVYGVIALGSFIALRHGRAGFVLPRPSLQLGRGAAVSVMTIGLFCGSQLMPLADAISIQFTSPMFVVLLSPLVTGEHAPRSAWVTILLAFAGVLLVLRPNVADLGVVAFLPVVASMGMAMLVMFNRKTANLAPVVTLQFWLSVMAAPILIVATCIGHLSGLKFLHVSVPQPIVLLKCAMVAVTGTTSHWMIYVATQKASAPVIAPMIYVQLLVAVSLGWMVFGDSIDPLSALGMALIILAGLLLWHFQRRPQPGHVKG